MYALHAVTIAAGMLVVVLGYRTLLFGIPSVIAVALNFLRRSQVRGSWIGTHFQWQWRTVCWLLLWLVVATVAFGSVVAILTRVPLLEISYVAAGFWAAWRLGQGWHALRNGEPVRVVEAA